jgi:hypothetical protein
MAEPHKCSHCPKVATAYVMGPYAGDWGAPECAEHAEAMDRAYGGRAIIERLPAPSTAEVPEFPETCERNDDK